MSGWGTGFWGLSSWGFGTGSTVAILNAYAVSEREVVVVFDPTRAQPLISNTIGIGDGHNPKTWFIRRNDTGQQLIVLDVEKIDDFTVKLYTLRKFTNYLIDHEVTCPDLLDTTGTLINPLNDDFIFPGCVAVKYTPTTVGLVDIRNAQFSNPTSIGGSWEVGTDGDYAVESGVAFLRKLIIRRLTTLPGEFFHLTQYGIGLRTKEPLRVPDMRKMKAAIELQLRKEPEFTTVSAPVSLDSKGILTINVFAKLAKSNQQVNIPIQVPSSSMAI